MDLLTYQTQLIRLNRRLQQHLSSTLRPCVLPYQITELQYEVLSYIDSHDTCMIKDLVKDLHQDAGNMSNTCKKLEERSFLKRIRDAEDERIVRLHISEQGAACVAQIQKLIEEHYRTSWESFPNKDKELIGNGLTRINQFLDYLNKKGEAAHD